MSKKWKDEDVSLDALRDKRVGIIGYGSQGSAQAKNLRDSGIDVVIGLRSGSASIEDAQSDGFVVYDIEKVVSECEIMVLLTPESSHKFIIEEIVNRFAQRGATLILAHGYTYHYKVAQVRDDLRVALVAPKAIGQMLRKLYTEGRGAPALIAESGGDLSIAKSYAKALGSGRAMIIESSFEEETECDLFGEQAVLCGGMPYLAKLGYETLVNAGYSHEAAFFECIYEIKLIADMIYEYGIGGMYERISDTALFGAMTTEEKLENSEIRKMFNDILESIQSREFHKNWIQEQNNHLKRLGKWLEIQNNNSPKQP